MPERIETHSVRLWQAPSRIEVRVCGAWFVIAATDEGWNVETGDEREPLLNKRPLPTFRMAIDAICEAILANLGGYTADEAAVEVKTMRRDREWILGHYDYLRRA